MREGFTKVGEDLKQKVYGQWRSAWSSLAEFARSTKLSGSGIGMLLAQDGLHAEEEKMLVGDMVHEEADETTTATTSRAAEQSSTTTTTTSTTSNKVNIGKLNRGRRVDYVLQESPIESFNEYLFAIASHVCYWESEDTLLIIIKEVFGLEYISDSNIEMQLSDQQRQQSSWLTQAAATAISTNVQRTFSFFNIGLPQSITSALTSSIIGTSGAGGVTQLAAANSYLENEASSPPISAAVPTASTSTTSTTTTTTKLEENSTN